jgi:hypothetical protein
MNLKERKKLKIFVILNYIKRILLSKKAAIFFLVVFGIIFFGIGLFSGMLFAGVFGTLDSPSNKMLKLMKMAGLRDLESVKLLVENIIAENIRIPFNYLFGQFTEVENMYIDINFKDYKKIEYLREQALSAGGVLETEKDWVPAKVKYLGGESKVDLRLKGDRLDHLEGDKWSFRIKVDGENTLGGMKVFSIQDPKTRAFLNEFLFHSALKREGLVSLRYNFIDVTINGEHKGIYALEEHFDKYLLENNERREGVIVKFDEDPFKNAQLGEFINPSNFKNNPEFFYITNAANTFRTQSVLRDPVKLAQMERANSLLESFKRGELKTYQVFDTDKLSKYLAVATILGAQHGVAWQNIRFYYNPITSLLEPIGYDGTPRSSTYKSELLEATLPSCVDFSQTSYITDYDCEINLGDFEETLTSDVVFFERYMGELERVANNEYLDRLLQDLDKELKRNLKIIHKDNPTYHFPRDTFYHNIRYISRLLQPPKSLEANFQKSSENTIVLDVVNLNRFPVEILSANYEDTIFKVQRETILQPKASLDFLNYKEISFNIPDDFKWEDGFSSNLKINYGVFGTNILGNESVLGWKSFNENFSETDFLKKEISLSNSDFIEINEQKKVIEINKGNWTLNESLIIPEGYHVFASGDTRIDLKNSAMILSYSSLSFIGNKDNIIRIESSDKTGQGLTVLNAREKSILNYVYFDNLNRPFKDNWELTGAINFYESPLELTNIKISNMFSEDALNIVRSEFTIDNINIEDSFSDCLDVDFSDGKIIGSKFINCGNDALDFSGSNIVLNNNKIANAGDKGISVGEESYLNASNIEIGGGFIGIASKDNSKVELAKIRISNCNYGFAVYQKKSEFGPASIKANDVEIIDCDSDYLTERGSSLSVNDVIILNDKKGVYNILYGDQ